MYDNAEEVLNSILTIVDKCPDPFKEKCFEVLLKGYVDAQLGASAPAKSNQTQPQRRGDPELPSTLVPATILPRLQTAAKRLGLSVTELESLFDFTKDPFGFHAIAVPGENKADTARKVAMAIAFKTYLSTGSWIADWKEVQAMSVDQNCYDRKNHAYFLRSGGNFFKSVEAGRNLELTSDGIKEAEKLIGALAKDGQR